MSASGYGRSLAYVRATSASARDAPVPAAGPVVTISRETGSGGADIALLVAGYAPSQAPGHAGRWPVLDKSLVQRAMEEHEFPQDLASYVPEDKEHLFRSTLEEILGLHPPTDDLVKVTNDTILRLANVGNVVILGRGANILTARMPNALHVRVVAPLARRILRVRERFQLTESEAAAFIKRCDTGRRRYLAANFDASIDDPLNYDLVINAGRLSFEACAKVICAALASR